MSAIRAIEPGLLLAAPSLGDKNFEGTVVLLGIHDEDGSLGWILNGPTVATAETIIRATELVAEAEPLPDGFLRGARRGGPVAPESVWILYDRRGIEEELPGAILVGDDIGITATREALAVLVAGGGPPSFHLLVGYAGWGAGQLEQEMALGGWLPSSANAPLVFHDELASLWRRAYADAIGTVPGAFVSTNRGSA